MTSLITAHISGVVEFLRRECGEDVSLTDIVHLAGVMTESLETAFRALDTEVSDELGAIASDISLMKEEISQLRPSQIREEKLPDAGRELDAVVMETETATHRIMEAAEAIMSSDIENDAEYRTFVSDQIVDIFEACAFQDITGQRIAKVVQTLDSIDKRVQQFIERTKMRETMIPDDTDNARDQRPDASLLNGPQHAGEGIEQRDVDDILDGDTSQADIDALFA